MPHRFLGLENEQSALALMAPRGLLRGMKCSKILSLVFWGSLGAGRLLAQTQLDLSTSSGWTTIDGKSAFTDANTKVVWSYSGTTKATSVYNLVGGGSNTSGTASYLYTTNPMLQVQTGYIGGTSADNEGVAFRFRLGAYDLATVGSAGLTAMIGMGPSASADKANMAIGVSFTVASGSINSWAVFYIDPDRAGSNGSANPADWTTSATWYSGGGAGKELNVVASSGLSSTQSSFINYQTASDQFVGTAASPNTPAASDAWLTFGITFKVLNDGVTSTTKSGGTFGAGTSQFNLAPAVYSGVVNTSNNTFSGAIEDYTNTSGNNAVFTNAIYLSGSTTSSVIPEASTFLMIPALISPLLFSGFRRFIRRNSR